MNQKALKTLEYHKIISQLTEYAGSAPGTLLCKNLMPATDYEAIVQAQTETTDAVSRIRLKGSLSFSGVRDIRDSLKRLGNRQRPQHSRAFVCQLSSDSRSPGPGLWPSRRIRGISR